MQMYRSDTLSKLALTANILVCTSLCLSLKDCSTRKLKRGRSLLYSCAELIGTMHLLGQLVASMGPLAQLTLRRQPIRFNAENAHQVKAEENLSSQEPVYGKVDP
ncbi:hypothetical protein PPACK8108_LOCUS21806 [Phakopsora pachyrhizi]|uniref:Uncharacterized protein n=1 Tax=Phakopsora pachyrhizi TaxID=170000 RepID=A0AAV0BKI7_PHAPC|nr:hypothetical protein PPACK8108_LOCUS21806 [Phakopsora pachyrhizi]